MDNLELGFNTETFDEETQQLIQSSGVQIGTSDFKKRKAKVEKILKGLEKLENKYRELANKGK